MNEINQLAEKFLWEHMERNPQTQFHPACCAIDKRHHTQAANHEDVKAFVAQLQEEMQRYEVTEVISEAEIAALAEAEWPAKPVGLILAKEARTALKFVVGFRRDSAVFSFDARLAKNFENESEVVAAVLDSDPVLRVREGFEGVYTIPAATVTTSSPVHSRAHE